jgi:hypothetical protein
MQLNKYFPSDFDFGLWHVSATSEQSSDLQCVQIPYSPIQFSFIKVLANSTKANNKTSTK